MSQIEKIEKMTFGDFVRIKRRKMGLKQADLARLTGISLTRMSSIEKSNAEPNNRNKKNIINALRITIEELDYFVESELEKFFESS